MTAIEAGQQIATNRRPICMISTRRVALFFSCLCLQALVWGADPPPEFTPEGVVGQARAGMLVPGAGMSIYGRYLGSHPGDCRASPDSLYAGNACDTQVLIGDKPAQLLFVSEGQINFKVPLDVPPSDGAELRVVYRGQSSLPLAMRVGPEMTTVSVDQPAHAGMPIWLKVELPFKYGTIHYPYILGFAGFGCNEVEVRKNGELLPLTPGSNAEQSTTMFVGNICGSSGPEPPSESSDRLPLHLLYDFRAPGTYEVRFTLRGMPFGALSQPGFKVRSEWTPFEILP